MASIFPDKLFSPLAPTGDLRFLHSTIVGDPNCAHKALSTWLLKIKSIPCLLLSFDLEFISLERGLKETA
jgi:hypothetical protein